MQASFDRAVWRTLLLLPLVVLVAATGCQSLPKADSMTPSWLKREKKPKVVESKFKRPVRMVVLWTPSILNEPGMPPTRGFGGRVYFYDENSETIPVEGQLVVYGYDENSPREGNAKADRKFVFPAEKIAQHFAPTDLGASYSIWVPWGQPTDPTTEVTLVSVLTSSSGTVVVDEGAKNNLPGAMTERQKAISKSANPDSLFSKTSLPETQDDAERDDRPKKLSSTTIPLAPKHAEQMASREPLPPVTNRVVQAAAYEPPAPQAYTRPAPRASEAESATEKEPQRPSKNDRRRRPMGTTGTLLGPGAFD
jgi:hypothetical protein